MKRFRSWLTFLMLAAVTIAAGVSLPVAAQELSGLQPARLFPMAMTFHNTTAASGVVRNAAWNASGGYTDSSVFRHAAAAPTSYDTSVSYSMGRFPLPPTFGPAYIPSAVVDTLFPWIIVKVQQDTTSYGFTGASGMDSVRVWAEFSDNQIDWYTASGTPTYRFDVVFATTGADGLVSPTLIGVELVPGIDGAVIPFKAAVNRTNGAAAMILNAPNQGQWRYMRFLIGGDMIGQYKAEIQYWSTSTDAEGT